MSIEAFMTATEIGQLLKITLRRVSSVVTTTAFCLPWYGENSILHS